MIMFLGICSGCSRSEIPFTVGYNDKGGFGSKDADGKLIAYNTGLVDSFENLQSLCEEWNNPAFQEDSEYYGSEISQKIRGYDEEFFKDKSLVIYSSFDGTPGQSFKIKNIRMEETELLVDIRIVKKRGTFNSIAYSWLIFIEVNKADVAGATSVQVVKK